MTVARAHSSSSLGIEPVNLAFVGVGRYGVHLGQDIVDSPLARIAACYDLRADAMEKFVGRFGGVAAGSLEEILAMPEIDGVVIATPNVNHRRSALMALSAQKHVYIEKPITTSTREAIELIQLADQVQRILMTGHNSRRAHPIRQLYSLVHSGQLGAILSVEGNFSTHSHLNIDRSHWAFRRDSMPGGALLEGGIHLIDICNYILGRPIAVNAVLRRRITPAESEDACAMLCRYTAPGGAGEGYFPDIPVSLTCLTAAPGINMFRVCGSAANGVVLGRHTELIVETPDGRREPATVPTPFDTLKDLSTRRQELDEFAYCIRKNVRPETDGVCGMLALAVVEAAILANGKSGEVRIDELGLPY